MHLRTLIPVALISLVLTTALTSICPAAEKFDWGSGATYTPTPPYPLEARIERVHGYGMVQIVCDSAGHVSLATMAYSTGVDLLDDNTTDFAKKHWRGQPNSKWMVPVEYRLTNLPIVSGAVGKSVQGWYTPMPPYPYASMRFLESGSGVVKVTTNAAGRVGEATMTQSTGRRRLDDATVYYALGFWHGPANSTREISVRFVIR